MQFGSKMLMVLYKEIKDKIRKLVLLRHNSVQNFGNNLKAVKMVFSRQLKHSGTQLCVKNKDQRHSRMGG